MALSDQDVKEIYQGNGATDTFAITFDWIEDEDVLVIERDETDPDVPVETELTLGSDYTVVSSDVVMAVAPAATIKLAVMRKTAPTQNLALGVSTNLNLTLLEQALDRMVRQTQEDREALNRTLQLFRTSPTAGPMTIAEPSVDKIIAFNADATGIVPTSKTMDEFEQAVEDCIDAAAAAASSEGAAAGSAASALASAQAAAISEANAAASAGSASSAGADAAAAALSAAAALVSENNAAASAIAAANSAVAADVSADAALVSETNAAASAVAADVSADAALVSENNAAASAAAAAASSAAPDIQGTRASPVAVVAAAGILFSASEYSSVHFVEGSGGPVDIVSTPQIQAGTVLAQRLLLVGRSDTNTIKLEHGTGLALKGGAGEIFLYADTVVEFIWDGTNWVQLGV